MKRRQLIATGYRAFTGHVFTAAEAQAYNDIQDCINRRIDHGLPVPEWLLNQSHRTFSLIVTREARCA